MAGGGGTRFWPRSRQKRPKQFLTLTGERTLLQMALDRIEAQVPLEQTWIITAGMHRVEVIQLSGCLAPCERDAFSTRLALAKQVVMHHPSTLKLLHP